MSRRSPMLSLLQLSAKGQLLACSRYGAAPGSVLAARCFSATARRLNEENTDFSGSNLPLGIKAKVGKNLHLQENHPLSLIRKRIYKYFTTEKGSRSAALTQGGSGKYAFFDDLSPYVTVKRNFDDLLFDRTHVGRNPSDTYYASGLPVLGGRVDTSHIPNADAIVMRTHTTAHQAEVLEKGERAYIVTGDVYRRDEIDASHYPVFHQMDGACVFEGEELRELGKLHGITVEDGNREQARAAVEKDLKATLEGLAQHLFEPLMNRAAAAHAVPLRGKQEKEGETASKEKGKEAASNASKQRETEGEAEAEAEATEPLEFRWVDAYFPFTEPSWELEILFRGEWLEVLGCGIIRQEILDGFLPKSSHTSQEMRPLGWAFGLGLERLAMVLYSIPDIRLFWTEDERFHNQFSQLKGSTTPNEDRIITFQPYSKYPSCYKDLSFWLPHVRPTAGISASGGAELVQPFAAFHENDFYELVRSIAGDLVEEVVCIDTFVHPKTGKTSKCFRINYRAMDRSLTNEEINELQDVIRTEVEEQLGVELR